MTTSADLKSAPFYFTHAQTKVTCAMLCGKSNFCKLTKNPYRTYLYLNLSRLCQIIIFRVPKYSSGTIPSWCTSDYSLVMSFDEARTRCKVEASGMFATDLLDILVTTWAVFIWRKTLSKRFSRLIVRKRRFFGLTGLQLAEALFLFFFVTMPIVVFILTSWKNVFGLDLEGSPPWRLCTFANYLSSPYYFSLVAFFNVLFGVAFLLFGKTLLTIKSQVDRMRGWHRKKQSSTQQTLKIWLRRHFFFSSLILIVMLLSLGHGVSVFLQGQTKTYKEAVFDFIQCRKTLSCQRTCEFKPPTASTSPLTLLLTYNVVFFTNAGRFAWVFFGELDWRALSRFRPTFKF